jgi:hypothetical protein
MNEPLSRLSQEVTSLMFILLLPGLKLTGAPDILMWFSSVPTKIKIAFTMKLRADYIWEVVATIQFRVFYFPIS